MNIERNILLCILILVSIIIVSCSPTERSKNSKLADGIFDQLIKTSIHSIDHEGIKNDSKYDENTFYIPNR